MSTIPHFSAALCTLFSSLEPLARSTGFVLRRSKLSGTVFVRTLVFGWLCDPDISLEGLCQIAATQHVRITPQALEQRFTTRAADFLQQVLAQAVAFLASFRPEPALGPLLDQFPAVYVTDCTVIGLPTALAGRWPGCGNASTPSPSSAALKASVRLELRGGQLFGPLLCPGRTHDRAAPLPGPPAPAGAVEIADLGYFSLDRFQQLGARGVYWLSRLQINTVFFHAGQYVTAETFLPKRAGVEVDEQIALGSRHQLPARLVALRVPPAVARERRRRLRLEARRRGQPLSRQRLALADWTMLVTNLPPERLTAPELLTLYGARWQIELLFKLWKSGGGLARSRSTKPARILCEVYAKLLAMVVQHGMLVVSCWVHPDRSLVRAARTVRLLAVAMLAHLDHPPRLTRQLHALRRILAAGCRVTRRRGRPSTYQRLLAVQSACFTPAQAA